MTHDVTCARFAARLSDLLEREVEESERAALESHALACGDCGPLLADVRKLRIDAANLPELVPSRDLWSSVAERITTPVIELQGRATLDRTTVSRRRRYLVTGLAAAGLVIATAGITYEVTRRMVGGRVEQPAATRTPAVAVTPPDTTIATRVATAPAADSATPAAQSPSTVRTVSGPTVSPEAAAQATAQLTYDREIARLRGVLDRHRSQLDPKTVTVIEMNLRVIDDAIAQCKQALRKDPASRFLMQSLNDELENKIELLRRAALLPLRSS